MDLEKLEAESRRLGAPIEPGNTLGVLRGNAVALVGVDAKLSRTDPQNYEKSIRVGTGYFDIPRLRPILRPGVYTLWTRLPKVELGLLRGQIEARKEDGDYGIQFPARYNIRSLHVPPDAQGIVRLLASPAALLEPDDGDDDWCIGIEWECDNGATFCLGFVFDPTPVPVPD
jgi:hypothetical protein